MDVQVRDRFSGVRAIIHHKAETIFQTQFFRELTGHKKEVAQRGLISRCRRFNTRDDFFRNDEQVDGRLRLDVVNNDALLVLVFDPCRNFPVDDFLEDRLGHGVSFAGPNGTFQDQPGSFLTTPHEKQISRAKKMRPSLALTKNLRLFWAD